MDTYGVNPEFVNLVNFLQVELLQDERMGRKFGIHK